MAKQHPELDAPNPEFAAWTKTLPPQDWARLDLTAARIGWEAARRGEDFLRRYLNDPLFHNFVERMQQETLQRYKEWLDGRGGQA